MEYIRNIQGISIDIYDQTHVLDLYHLKHLVPLLEKMGGLHSMAGLRLHSLNVEQPSAIRESPDTARESRGDFGRDARNAEHGSRENAGREARARPRSGIAICEFWN